ncbi:hypothetical protein AB0395_04310 [Streptosporangium sp. NPDC051023]|uniref:hypothetical protein n=1 Tax=Streptosporangium sp. NPDC051023 TaxID=3155410 RepID=UPI00344F07E1
MLAPARSATRVHPVAALRRTAATTVRRSSVPRAVAGLVAAVAGFAVLVTGGTEAGVVGGLVSMAGVLLASRVIVPAVVSPLRRPLRAAFGVPGHLAGDGAVRAPGRKGRTDPARRPAHRALTSDPPPSSFRLRRIAFPRSLPRIPGASPRIL